jgi:hypothetical protein
MTIELLKTLFLFFFFGLLVFLASLVISFNDFLILFSFPS